MIKFEEFLNENDGKNVADMTLNEAQLKLSNDDDIVSTISDIRDYVLGRESLYGTGYSYKGDFNLEVFRGNGRVSVSVTNTSKFCKSGKATTVKFYGDLDNARNFIEYLDKYSITHIAELLDDKVYNAVKDSGVIDVNVSEVSNSHSTVYNPFVATKNIKPPKTIKGKKLTRAVARKIIATGDFEYIGHYWQENDGNMNSSGKLETTFSLIQKVLGHLDSKNCTVHVNNEHSETFWIWVHSNLTYTIYRKD